MIEAIYVLASMFYRDVVDQVNAAVDETPNTDPLPWTRERESRSGDDQGEGESAGK